MATLGIVVPCRDEEAVIERKLENLASAQWPPGRHHVVVVDDGSGDATAARARERGRERFGAGAACVDLRVVENRHAPGKAGAIRTGLESLPEEVTVVVLTDADVIFRPEALGELSRAFDERERLGMACGAQEFVASLAADGSARASDLGALEPAPETYDVWTAGVRGLESRWGKLFSVHGQLLAWRRELGLVPTAGIAADDLDLMLQVRARGRRVERIESARFLEAKTPHGERRATQALRRAGAYFQALAVEHTLPTAVDRLQLAAYRLLPRAAPELALLGALLLGLVSVRLAGWIGLLVFATLGLGLALTRRGRELLELLKIIRIARRGSSRRGLSDRWEMQRT